MAKKPTARPPAPPALEVNVDHDTLQATAMQMYMQLASRRGYTMTQNAEESFALAAGFLQESERIRAGGDIKHAPKHVAAPVIRIHEWEPVKNKDPLFDDAGKPITSDVKGDPYAFAPKLPAGHPINQRFFLTRHALGMEVPKEFQRALDDHLKEIPQPN